MEAAQKLGLRSYRPKGCDHKLRLAGLGSGRDKNWVIMCCIVMRMHYRKCAFRVFVAMWTL